MTERSLTEAQRTEAIILIVESNASVVRGWRENKPGSWGVLAGKAVIACRQRLGRGLTEQERRTVWHALWRYLTELK